MDKRVRGSERTSHHLKGVQGKKRPLRAPGFCYSTCEGENASDTGKATVKFAGDGPSAGLEAVCECGLWKQRKTDMSVCVAVGKGQRHLKCPALVHRLLSGI